MFDVLVIGAGPAGAVVGLVVARRGLRVLLLERGGSRRRRVGETIPGVASTILRELALWNDFQLQAHRPAYALRSIWGGTEPRERSSVFDRHGPGFHLAREAFDAWLLDHALRAGAMLEQPVRVLAMNRAAGGSWNVDYSGSKGERSVEARVVVDATGERAWASRRADATREHSHRMVAVARWFARDDSEPVTVVEAAREGWWYSAPLPGGALVLVWMTDAESASARAGQSDDIWMRCLESAPATLDRWRGAEPIADAVTRATGPAVTRWLPHPDFVPVGDAACRFDPLSGTGLCFALRSALDAAGTIEEGLAGNASAFTEYRAGVARVFDEHLLERQRAYRAEQRFPESGFWQRAQADPSGL